MANEITAITAENLHTKSDAEILAVIGCYGMMFNPSEALCVGCMAKARCLHKLAMVNLPQEALERGAYDADHERGSLLPRPERLDMNEVAREMGTEGPVLQYAFDYWKSEGKIGLPVLQADGRLVPTNSGPPTMGPPPSPALAPEPVKETPPEVPEATDEEEEEEVEMVDPVAELAAEPEAPKEETMKKAKSKKKPEKKAPAKKAPVKKAKAEPKKTPGKKARPQKAPPKQEAGEQDPVKVRFQRDIERLGLEKLPHGTVIQKKVQATGKTHEVKLTAEGWEYKKKLFPTLYAVQMAITGGADYAAQKKEDGSRPKGQRLMATMSASRFFNLPRVLKELGK